MCCVSAELCCCTLQSPLVPISATRAEQERTSLVGVTAASVASSIYSAAGLAICTQSSNSAAGVGLYSAGSQSVQSDNSFDAEYCDVEPDSSPGSVTHEDIADMPAGATYVSADVGAGGKDLWSNSSSCNIHAELSATERTATLLQPTATVDISRPTNSTIVTGDNAIHTSLPVFSSTTRADLLPKSALALACEKFPSPVKHNSDVFSPVLPLLTTGSLTDYVAPVMVAESSTRCLRFLPATAAALCDTSTVSSPSFARSLCAAISTTAKRPHLEPTVTESSSIERQVCNMSVPSIVSGLVQHDTVVTSSTPVMADVLQAQLDQGSLHQLSAAALPVMRTARLTDHAELLNALLSPAQLGISKTEALGGAAGRQQALPNNLTVPVIAFLNLGAGTGSLPSFSCATVLPPGALQLLKMSASNESVTSSIATGTVTSADQARLL